MTERKKDPEEILKELPQSLSAIMNGWHFSKRMRQRVQKRIAFLPVANDAPDQTPVWRKKSFGRIAWIAASVLILLGIFWWRLPAARQKPPAELKMLPVETRYIDLDGRGSEEMVSIWRIEGLDHFIVFVGFRENDQWNLKYAYPLHGHQILPVELIDSARGQGKEVLITYRKPESGNFYYLILKDDGRVITPVR
ncbi:MAG: hypothetical protein AB1556_04895 [Bacillota bacterium]